MTGTVHLVVNPSSGRGRARRVLPRVLRRLADRPNSQLEVHSSLGYDEARAYTRHVVERARPGDLLAVMGGDGMAHLGLNACAGTEVPLAIIPAGTGNDFVRGAGLPRSVAAATDAVVAGNTRRIDLMHTTDASGPHWVGSVLSTGYDAQVNHATNQLDHRARALGGLAYAGVALGQLARFTPVRYRLEIDGRPRELDSVLVAVANAGYFGGGMHILPRADVTDGLLDVLLVHELSRAQVLQLLPRLYVGAHEGHPAVEMVRAREVLVDGDGLLPMADGEPLGAVPTLARCVPGAVVLVG